ncbi:HAMP domain-containing methyl-accepting chemotaxis protein [Parerythrobacter aurantius]|uniref:methyl-accepting chemotaxis protein n=1 Tax=Parerythrobacter aurantius TaxID=3127706 RepID=UPI0032510C7B
MNIQQTFSRGGYATVALLLATLLVGAVGVSTIRFGGPLHRENEEINTYIADILPPPQYIIEPYLEATLAIRGEGDFEEHRLHLRHLREEHDERTEYWQGSSIDASLRKQLLDKAGAESDQFWNELDNAFLPALARNDRAAAERSYQRLSAAYERHRAQIDIAVKAALAQQKRIHDQAADSTRNYVAIIGALALALAALLLTGLRFVRRRVVMPLGRIARSITRVVDGDLVTEIEVPRHQDEVAEVAAAIEVFRQRSVEKLEHQAQLQREREQASAERTRELLALADRIETGIGAIVNDFVASSGRLRESATALASSAEQSAKQSGEVSKAISETAEGVTAAASASDEFALTIGEISKQASSSADLARNSTEAAAQADAKILSLDAAADEAGKVIEMISTIAARTSLLALNASIEAARASEAGRGFAVVASEVTELARQTSQSSDQVAALIKAIQETSDSSVEALGAITNRLAQLEISSTAIASAVDQQACSGQEMARSIDRAASGADVVAQNVRHLHDAARMTGDVSAEVLAASTDLERQAGELSRQIGQFVRQIRAG